MRARILVATKVAVCGTRRTDTPRLEEREPAYRRMRPPSALTGSHAKLWPLIGASQTSSRTRAA